MSVFKRSLKKSGSNSQQSTEAKSRLEHQLYLARECPDPVFDISSCELTEVPKGVFSICKVLQKESLLIYTNNLSYLKGGGNLSDLCGLRVLDLHNNQLKSLPAEIGILQSLQILNVERNQLESLPESIETLTALQTLNLKGNRLRAVPNGLCNLCSLRFLDISDNLITNLPRNLSKLKTLEVIAVDALKMVYPPAAICTQGTEAMMKLLCQDSGTTYVPPSTVLLGVLPSPVTRVPDVGQLQKQSSLDNSVMQYESLKEKKRVERLVLEKQLEEDQRHQSLLAANAAASKNHLLEFVAYEQNRLSKELTVAQQRKEAEKEKLRQILTEAERNAGELVSKLLEMNERARKTEELLEQMEKERNEVERWYLVQQEELENIRRRDVLSSMEEILRHNELLSRKIKQYLTTQDIKKLNALHHDTDEQVETALSTKQKQQKVLVERLLTEESLQKEMFEVLQCQKDARHRRITSQIRLIEQELAELTLLEIEQRSIKLDVQMNILAKKKKVPTATLR